MGWFVRYIDDELKHEMLSRELATEEEALEEAWQLAQGDNEVIGIDGPDEESVANGGDRGVVRTPFRNRQNGVFVLTRLARADSASRLGLKNSPLLTPRQPLTRLFSSARSICD